MSSLNDSSSSLPGGDATAIFFLSESDISTNIEAYRHDKACTVCSTSFGMLKEKHHW